MNEIQDNINESFLADFYELQGMEGETLEDFYTRIMGQFTAARDDPEGGVVEQETGVVIADVPEMCPESTNLARDELVAYEA